MNAQVIEVSEADFQDRVIEESKKRLVLVDFWAPWCGPCRTLTPIMERLAAEYGGRVMLAKVNSDENPAIASNYGVRSIPSVKAFSGGEIVDEFTGAMPEGMVRQFIERVLPGPAEEKRRAAMQLFASGEAEQALDVLEQAQALESDNDLIRTDRAEILISLGRSDEAAGLIEELAPLAAMDDRVEHLKAQLTFADTDGAPVEIEALETKVAGEPGNLQARLSLAKKYVAARQFEAALHHCLEITRRDRSFGDDAGRKTMLAIFELLGNDHQLTARYRRQLAASLH